MLHPKISFRLLINSGFLLFLLISMNGCVQPSKDNDNGSQDEPGSPSHNAIYLLSRTIEPNKGLGAGVNSYMDSVDANRVHLLVQFESRPGANERKRLTERLGVEILDTVPERAYFVGLPNDIGVVKQLLEGQPRADWADVVEPKDKLSPALWGGKVPAYTRRHEDMVELFVLFFGDVEEEQQKQQLGNFEAELLTRMAPVNGWQVLLKEEKIKELSHVDIVKWIEHGPPPPEEDNDGARSSTALNSDSVTPPALYNLSGAGETIAHWEGSNASLTHGDFTGTIVLGDPPIPINTRSTAHDESVVADTLYATGEAIYTDIDDSATVSVGDVRRTPVAAFAAGSVVALGDADIGTVTVLFQTLERFEDSTPIDGLFSNGEAVYLDSDGNIFSSLGTVSAGDTRLTATGGFAAGSIVVAGDADIGTNLRSFRTNPHYHATHVAATTKGSGAQSVAAGGSANQWKGVAPSATLRSYRVDFGVSNDYPDAAVNNASLSVNSWGYSHHHQVTPPSIGYGTNSAYYDAVVSGRQSDGSPSGLARTIEIFGSAGNRGRPERHTEHVAANAQYDLNESIYIDNDDSGAVSGGDSLRLGVAQALGTALIDFNLNEMHDESVNTGGLLSTGEAIYRDADSSRTVSTGDTRITAAGALLPAGSVVAIADVDVGLFLRQFRLWGNVRVPNSAKDTVVVANVRSDTKAPSPSSSRGPTNDGRLKPDVSGPGSEVGGDGGIKSAFPGNAYTVLTGTSMSTPAITGSGGLISEWYRQAMLAAGPLPATLKALMIHAAEDLTSIPNIGAGFAGPDFSFGYGRVDVENALALVPHHLQGTVATVGDTDYTFTTGIRSELKVTLAWDDPAWTANAAASPATGILQNDLDLVLIAPDGTQFTPWILNSTNPVVPATRASFAAAVPIPLSARDKLNVVEQVVVDNAIAGTWTIRVTGSTLNQPGQDYVLVSEAIPPQDSPASGLLTSDVWMMDNALDTGAGVSSGTLYLSPDVWNRNTDDDMTGHLNPEHGQPNYLYANLRNRHATNVAVATTVEFWLAQAATGLAWPTNFSLVGELTVPNLPASSVRQIGPLEWLPPAPAPSNHFCFYIRVTSTQDPITFAEGPAVSTNTANSNNIAWRNVNIVDLLSSKAVTFLVRNLEDREAPLDLFIEVPEQFLEVGEVYVQLDPVLEQSWRGRNGEGFKREDQVRTHPFIGEDLSDRRLVEDDPELQLLEPKERSRLNSYRVNKSRAAFRGIRMETLEAFPVTIIFSSELERKASFKVNVFQEFEGKRVGGIVYEVRTGHGN